MAFTYYNVRQAIFFVLIFSAWTAYASEFNTDVLDAEDLQNVDLSKFSVAGYVPPGNYALTIFVNGQRLGPTQDIQIFEQMTSEQTLLETTCIPADLLDLIGLKESTKEKVHLSNDKKCLNLSDLTGTQIKIELATLSLKITIPQFWMEYRDPDWIPPTLWEDGINGALLDYSTNISATKENIGNKRAYASMSGTMGLNLGALRFRGDYNGSYQKQQGSRGSQETHQFDFSRLYAFISIKSLLSVLTLGENYFYSNVFESWQYTGLSLESDDLMLPPKLVGYAPEIIGVADSNATVIVRNKNRVLLETTVPPGPFRIQTLDSGIRGILDVTVREENGEEKKFSLNTASLPYLTRPGRLNYKFVAGKTRRNGHQLIGSSVVGGELSYGLSNEWSLYGGAQLNSDYQTMAVGIGRDLYAFGAISFDVTQSVAHVTQETLQGRSYRLNYSKSFDSLRTDITFAGYRFADKNYRTLSQFMDEASLGYVSRAPKENYQIFLNKYFDNFNFSLNYQYNTYWYDKSQMQYGLYTSTNISLPGLSQQDSTITVSAIRTERDGGYKDDAVNLYFSIPLYNGHSVSLSESYTKAREYGQYSHTVGYSGYNERDSYNLSLGYNHGQLYDSESSISGYYSRDLSQANISVNASYVPQQYHSIGLSINSGITATGKGIALHQGSNGDTRLMIETPGISGVPFDNGTIKTNMYGFAVIPNVNSYRKTNVSINTSKLPDNLETLSSSTDITLTKGAIGYRSLSVMKGEKLFAIISLGSDKTPPFGASVRNANNLELGIVGEDGVTWLVGISSLERLFVYWGGKAQCELSLPEYLDTSTSMLLLPCASITK